MCFISMLCACSMSYALLTFDEYQFTYLLTYLLRSVRCQMTLNHMRDGVGHDAGKQHLCHYQDQYDNLFYLCKVPPSLTCHYRH